MGVYDKGGNPHHSQSRANFSDSIAGDKKPPAAAPAKKAAPAAGGDANDVSKMKIGAVVKQHGPAHDVAITHDHGAGHHHVHSTHGDKHHHSDHGTAQLAHNQAAQAAGVTPGQESEQEDNEMTPDSTGDQQHGAPAPAGIPGMA